MSAWTRSMARVNAGIAYAVTHKRVVAPVAIVILVVLNVGLAVLLSPVGTVGTSRVVDLSSARADTSLETADADGDGLSDLEELYLHGTDANDLDTDGDGLPDAWEVRYTKWDPTARRYTPDPLRPDADADPDSDGFTNAQELAAGTDPNLWSTADDGFPDGWKGKYGLDPNTKLTRTADLDGDGLSNAREFELGTNPIAVDTDRDGLADAAEVDAHGTDPTKYSTAGTGIGDGWLLAFQLDPLNPRVAYEDLDRDGLTTLEEYLFNERTLDLLNATDPQVRWRQGLSPILADTDGDGMSDGWEVTYALNPLDSVDGGFAEDIILERYAPAVYAREAAKRVEERRGRLLSPATDPDGDNLTNYEEFLGGSSPHLVDSDGDSLSDRDEIFGWEITVDGEKRRVHSNPLQADSDGDGLTDEEERNGKDARGNFCVDRACPLDPSNPDTDLDGLGDAEEIRFVPRLDPLRSDSDGDGILDGIENRYWLERAESINRADLTALRDRMQGARDALRLKDPTNESLKAPLEQVLGPAGDLDGDALANIVDADSDGDGIPDGLELVPGLWRASPGSEELQAWVITDPALADTDGDGLPDSWEKDFTNWDYECVSWNLNPNLKNSFIGCARDDGLEDGARDLDQDGVAYTGGGYAIPREYKFTNFQEYLAGTAPNDRDTDGDGIDDGWEVYFNLVGRQTGKLVPLSPLDGNDADGVATSYTYSRYVTDLAGAPRPEEGELQVNAFPDIANPAFGGRTATVFLYQGTFTLSFLDAFKLRVDPTVFDTDGDGMSDAWEAYHFIVSGNDAFFSPIDAGGGVVDFDGDELTNAEEFRWGTNPLVADTDLGGIPDGQEAIGDVPSNPLDPKDDDPFGDADDDGLSNVDELTKFKTRVSDFDTDRDGLLDGPNVELSDVHLPGRDQTLRDRYLARGVYGVNRGGNHWTFFGEMNANREIITDPLKWDSDGDGMPDGWEVAYNLFPVNPSGPILTDADALTDLMEYQVGRPASWDEARNGPWWFGTNPRAPDTDADGGFDGRFDSAGVATGRDFDHDNDGLNDFIGEDPFPFYDHANTGTVDVRSATTMYDWVFNDGRRRTRLADADADTIPDAEDTARVTITNVVVHYTHAADPVTIFKGENVYVTGRVHLAHDSTTGVANLPVVINLGKASGLASATLGLALTGPDGRFNVSVDLVRDRSYTVPADAGRVVILGETRNPGDIVMWTLDTTNLVPDTLKQLVVWTYGSSVDAGKYTFPGTPCRNSCPSGSTFTANGVEGKFESPLVVSDLIKLKTATRFKTPAIIVTANDKHVTERITLIDAAGDPVPKARVTATWRGIDSTATTDTAGVFTLDFAVGAFPAPTREQVTLTFNGLPPGDRLWDRVTSSLAVAVAFPTTVTGDVDERANPSRVAVAGGNVVVLARLVDYQGRAIAGENVSAELLGSVATSRTDADGRARIVLGVPATAAVGNQPIILKYGGENPLYAKSSHDAGIIIIKQRAIVSLTPGRDPTLEAFLRASNVILNESLVPHAATKELIVTGRLLDQGGATARDQTLRNALAIEISGPGFREIVRADNSSGSFRVTIPVNAFPSAGPYLVTARFAGSTFYDATQTESSVLVLTRTALSAPSAILIRGQNATVAGTLMDDLGRGVADGSVTIALRDGIVATAKADKSGRFVATFPIAGDAQLGPARLTLRYNGSADHTRLPAPTIDVPIRILSATKLVLPAKTLAVGTITLNGTLFDDRGKPVGGERVQITLDGKPAGAGTTDLTGVFEVVYETGPVSARDYSYRAHFPGSVLYAASETTTFVRLKSTSRIEIEDVSSAVRTRGFFVNGSLMSGVNVPIGGAAVDFTLLPNGSLTHAASFGRTTTHPLTGVFNHSTTVPGGIPLGTYPLRIRFAGDANHVGKEILVPVDVVSFSEIRVELPSRLVVGESFTAKVFLTNDAGEPVPNAIVYVQFSGYRFPFTLKTGEDGTATFPGKVLEPGASEVRFAFAGDNTLLSTQDSRAIRISGGGLIPDEARTWVYVGAGLAILAIIAAALLYWWRRSQVEEARQILAEAQARLLAGNEYIATILAAYKRLVDHLVKFGYATKPSLTAQEFAVAAKAALPVRAEPLDELVSLFEEARYSDHVIGARERDRAIACLAAINRDLARAPADARLPPPESTEGSA